MHRPLRPRRVLKWLGTLVCFLSLLAAAASFRWTYVGITDAVGTTVFVAGGSIGLNRTGLTDRLWYSAGTRWVTYRASSWSDFARDWSARGRWVQGSFPRPSGEISVPLWMPIVLFGIPTVLLWRADRRPPAPGHCRACGYNLTGNTTGRCPECGTDVTLGKDGAR